MKSGHFVPMALIALLLSGGLWTPASSAAPLYDKQQCLLLFTQLNRSGTGQLSASEAAADPTVEKAFLNPAVRRTGVLTEGAFTELCMSTESPILEMRPWR